MSLSDEDFIRHILDEVRHIAAFMKDKNIEDLRTNIMLDRAVTRSLEIMGEASRKISKEYKKKYPSLPWREMSDTRNRIIHFYFGIDHEVIMDIVTNELPDLTEKLTNLLVTTKAKKAVIKKRLS